MYFPDKKTFVKLAEKGNVIPVYREILADFETPLSAFVKIDGEGPAYLLESVEGGEHMARYSFLGSDPSLVIESRGRKMSFIRGADIRERTVDDPIDEVRKYMDKFTFVDVKGLPRFSGGLVGYFGYDMVRFIEDIPDNNTDETGMPEMRLMLTDTILIFDHIDHKIKVVSNCLVDRDDPAVSYDKAVSKIDALIEKLRAPSADPVAPPAGRTSETDSNVTEEEFTEIVERARENIRAGEVIQIVLSQRFGRKTAADPFTVYRALRSINPSPYMFYLKNGGEHILGASPEILVRCEDRRVEVRPIAGTRKRGGSVEEDRSMERELLSDPKERAEHVMLVDLGRNDIGRVCRYSSIKVPELMGVEKYSHVMHIVSDVVGELDEDKDIYDLFRATFPAGTVTGAPKVRAMELIDELENTRRGIYAGSVGYISFSGNLDLCITIRTILMRDNAAYVQAGAGIVLDSVPELEYEETRNKARGMLKAIDAAEKGLE
ncbi:MAG: anthranilate synthase component I [Candidatus Omnitrophica bacterium]|nr:anthranilate synthase component I [Candidatus Omnitrophota bacterium]